MDSKPNFDKYDDYLMTENRYANLKQINPKDCDKILDNQKKWAISRYNYYKVQDNRKED